MSEHRALLTWNRGDRGFTYKEFSRDHDWAFPRSGRSLEASAAVTYLGSEDRVDPEEAFVASLASCHLLTFLAVASMSGYTVDQYEDSPIGLLEPGPDKRPWLSRIVMHPRVVFSGAKLPGPEQLEALHEKAHKECFLANSVKTEVTWEIRD
ncbi:MAG: OsmC family protein [Verrucomicrobiales bacterium]